MPTATITSIELHLKSIIQGPPFSNLTAYIHDVSAVKEVKPDATTLLDTSNPVDIATIDTSPEWVTFTFATPVEISTTGWYGFAFKSDVAGADFVRIYRTTATLDWRWDNIFRGSEWLFTFPHVIKVHITGIDDFIEDNITLSNAGNFDTHDYGVRLFLDFDLPPSKPTNPAPADVAASIALGLVELSWDDGGDADDYDVYFGPTGGMTLQSSGQVGTTWALIAPLSYGVVYQWRIDANNAFGTTTGDTWSFTALVFAPPIASGGGSGGEFGGQGGLNNMVTVKRLVVAAANEIFFEDE